MEYFPFPCCLRSTDNTVKEYGQATIVANDNAIDFTGEFVPLLPLGTQATIEWILGDRILASFFGNVYLSSRDLLRLINIDFESLVSVRDIFATNTTIPALYSVKEKQPLTKTPLYKGEILFLTNNRITLKTNEYIAVGQTLSISAEIDFLTLNQMPVLVEQRILIRRGEALLICKTLASNNENKIAMATYSAKLAEKERKANL